MNVLEIPIQAKASNPSRNGSSTSVDSRLVFTLDPSDKYRALGVRRAATTSAIQRRKSRELLSNALKPRLFHSNTDLDGRRSAPRTGQSTLEKQPVLLSIFSRMRQTRSAGSNLRSGLAWPRKIFSRSGSRAGQPTFEGREDVPEVPQIPCWASGASESSVETTEMLKQKHSVIADAAQRSSASNNETKETTTAVESTPVLEEAIASSSPPQDPQSKEDASQLVDRTSMASPSTSYSTPDEQLCDSHSYFETTPIAPKPATPIEGRPKGFSVSSHSQESIVERVRNAFGGQATHWALARSLTMKDDIDATPDDAIRTSIVFTESSISSYAHSGDFSPVLTDTTHSGPMSPLHLSQPETPAMSEFDFDGTSVQLDAAKAPETTLSDLDHVLKPPSRAAPPPPCTTHSPKPYIAAGFQGYCLPEDDRKSIVTIRKLPSMTFQPADASSPFAQQDRQEMVHSWIDGSEHMSSLEEFVGDHSYLGHLIN